MKKKTILVTGGAGFIGSHVNKLLHDSGYDTIVLDNLSHGSRDAVIAGKFIEGDVGDSQLTDKIFRENPIDAVMHFAAFIDVGESIELPIKYFSNNVFAPLRMMKMMVKNKVKKFIFSSSAAVYGIPAKNPVDEAQPCTPINPYGISKRRIETILDELDKEINFRSISLRYFNASGGDPAGKIKNDLRKQSNLIPRALLAAKHPGTPITIYGTDYATKDGTCIRDYIHVEDLASAHLLALENLLNNDGKTGVYNLGNGKGFSVREVLTSVENVTGKKLSIVEGHRRPGDPPELVADAHLAQRQLGWAPRRPALDEIILDAWKAAN